MFKPDINAQAEKLMSTLGLMIANLRDAPTLVAMVKGLGQRHVAYGVKDEHYGHVGAALPSTLETMLGDAFTEEAKAAWSELYPTAAAIMREAAQKSPSAAPVQAQRVAAARR
jgi:hemoglobin-like flavoprotein